MKIGSAQNALNVFIDSEGFIRNAAQPFQVFDGWSHKTRELQLFTMHRDRLHQKFVINHDWTISMKMDLDYVLGTDTMSNKVCFVKKGDPNSLVFYIGI